MAITKLVITGNTTSVGLSSDPLTISLVENIPASLVTVNTTDDLTNNNAQDALETLATDLAAIQISSTGSAEALDDYEEGTFTPIVKVAGDSSPTVVYGSLNYGDYIKIGNLVTLNGCIHITSLTTSISNGTIVIGGIPFQHDHQIGSNLNQKTPSGCVGKAGKFAAQTPSGVHLSRPAGTTEMFITKETTTGYTDVMKVSDIDLSTSHGTRIHFTITYMPV